MDCTATGEGCGEVIVGSEYGDLLSGGVDGAVEVVGAGV